ncbi:MAG: hypothetical protein K0R39_2213 [Symbiobacteriaceae bacterium]|jgi:nitrite reductase (NO-forming)|nr:hypothetical protein [Symbiobacteriaceae bacterium]
MKRLIVTLVMLLATAALAAGCGGSSGPTREIAVTMGPDMVFTPAEITGTVGETLLIRLTNADVTLEHDMVISAFGARVRLFAGQSGSMTVKLKKAGEFEVLCTLPGHTEAGMVGVLKVTK